jgi:hypothetical protein
MIVDERNGEILQTENKNQSFKLVSVVDGDIIKIERD